MPRGSGGGRPLGSQNVPLQQGPLVDGYPLLVNIAPGIALIVDVDDRPGRLLGVIYGENDQLQQLTPADGVAPNESLEVTGFNMVYDAVAGDWNRWVEGATEGVPQVEDTGLNTNPRRYEKDNGFYSAPTTVGAGATDLYTEATTPARTAGELVTIYQLHIHNATGAAGGIWLEIGGVAVTVEYAIATADTVCVDFPAGLTLGDNDIDVNGTADIVVQISGTEA